MGGFLKLIAAICLTTIWLFFGIVCFGRRLGIVTPYDAVTAEEVIIALVLSILLSIWAVAFYGFGQIVSDVRAMRNHEKEMIEHLEAMRAYFAILNFNEDVLISNQKIASNFMEKPTKSEL